MEYDEPEEVIAADAKAFEKLMLTLDRSTARLIASQLSRAYRTGRERGSSEAFSASLGLHP